MRVTPAPRPTLDPSGPYMRHPLQPHQLLDRITRVQDTIVLCRLGVPRLEADAWSMSVDGLVRRPLHLTLADLKRRPRAEITSIHQCCGSPLHPEVPTRRVCNVVWGGVTLSGVLAECEPDPAARFIWSIGADHGVFNDVSCEAYVKDLPLERAADDVLIAFEMNGAPLPPENGYPARLVIPGYYGTNSVKWLSRMTLASSRAPGPFTTRWYNDPVHDASGQPTGEIRPVRSIAPESVIVSPAPGQSLAVGESIDVWGWAWADTGAASVEVNIGDGDGWMPAALEPPVGHAWQRFAASWRPRHRGEHVLCSRARSADGQLQPASGARNEVYRVPVHIA